MALACLLARPAQAAHWAVTYACSGTNTTPPSQPINWAPAQNTNPATESCGYGPYTSAVSSGSLTATLTWTKDGEPTLPPAPSQVYLLQTLNCSATGSSAGSTVTDGWGDAFPGSGTANCSGQFAHSLQMDNSALKTTLTLQPVTATVSAYNKTGGGGNCYVSLNLTTTVVTYALNITLTGTTPDSSGAANILIGQGCSAGLSATGCTVSTPYQWSVSGTTFQDWEPTTPAMPNATPPTQANPNASYESDGTGLLTNSTAHWFWNDLQQTSETVKCTANVTPTGQSPMQVTVSKQIIVQVPTFKAFAFGGYMQVNMANPNDTTHNNLWAGPTAHEKNIDQFPAGMNWQASVTTPSTPAFGTGKLELVQIVSTGNSVTTVANPTVVVPDPNNQYPMSLDLTYPYGYHVASEMPAPAIPYQDNDSPSARLDGATKLASANKGGSYYDYLMYMPPVATGSTSMWVLLSTFNWTANGSASIPTGNNWSLYASQHGGSDYAGAVSPPGSNPPQNNAPTPNPFTPATVPNTFPKWTHID